MKGSGEPATRRKASSSNGLAAATKAPIEELVRAHQGIAVSHRIPGRRERGRGRGSGPGGLRQGLPRAGQVSFRFALSAVAAQIVANEARNRRRSEGRRAALAVRAAAEKDSSGGAAPSPEGALLAGEERGPAARRRQRAARGGTARDRVPLLPRAFRGGDRRPCSTFASAPSSRARRVRSTT